MPSLTGLGLSWLRHPDEARQATHEDYTVAFLQHTSMTGTIADNFPFNAQHVAALIRGDVRCPDNFFVDDGLDHRRLLSQIVSSELDVDRLDYLVRDAMYTGANYGQVDVNWLLSNLDAWAADGQVQLALDSRAVYAFDHFLIARHHMFLMVYFHHKSVVYEELLRRYVHSPNCTWSFPDIEQWLHLDDVALTSHLRQSSDPWARRIVEHRPFRRVMERHGSTQRDAGLADEEVVLREAGLDVIRAASTGRLSRYNRIGRKRKRAPEIWVLDRMPGHPVEKVRTLTEASGVFQRYADERRIARLYVAPENVVRARRLLNLPVSDPSESSR